MADLITHYAVARIAGLPLPNERDRILLVAGSVVPDILSKTTSEIIRAGDYAALPSHSFIGAVLVTAALVQIFEQNRARYFFLVLCGWLLHVLVDLLKTEAFGNAPFFPIWNEGVGGGLYLWIDAAYFIPVSVVVVAAIELFMLRRRNA